MQDCFRRKIWVQPSADLIRNSLLEAECGWVSFPLVRSVLVQYSVCLGHLHFRFVALQQGEELVTVLFVVAV